MNIRDLIKFALIVVFSVVVFIFLSSSVTAMRGYWAVGGEIFIPIIMIVWGGMTVFGGSDEK